MPAISVIVCTFNRAPSLGVFLNRLETHILHSKLDAELVLVDNNSSDTTPDVLADYEAGAKLPVTVVREHRQGSNHARNTGIRNAHSPLLVFTEDDVDFSDSWLRDFADYMQAHPECQVATGKIFPKFQQPRPEWLHDDMLGIYGRQDFGEKPVALQFPSFPCEGNMAVRASVFERHGGFSTVFNRDDKTLMSNDGKIFFHQLSQQEEVVRYIPDALLFHLIPENRTTPAWYIRRIFWQGVSDVAFQQQINSQEPWSEIRRALPDLLKLLNQLRGGHLSPSRIHRHWQSLPVSSQAGYAYRLGVLARRLRWK